MDIIPGRAPSSRGDEGCQSSHKNTRQDGIFLFACRMLWSGAGGREMGNREPLTSLRVSLTLARSAQRSVITCIALSFSLYSRYLDIPTATAQSAPAARRQPGHDGVSGSSTAGGARSKGSVWPPSSNQFRQMKGEAEAEAEADPGLTKTPKKQRERERRDDVYCSDGQATSAQSANWIAIRWARPRGPRARGERAQGEADDGGKWCGACRRHRHIHRRQPARQPRPSCRSACAAGPPPPAVRCRAHPSPLTWQSCLARGARGAGSLLTSRPHKAPRPGGRRHCPGRSTPPSQPPRSA